MSLTKISSTVVSAQDEEDLYCRPCNKFFPNIQAYRRHMERTVRHEKLERFAKSAIELSVNASDGVQKDSTLSSVNSQEQDEFNTDKSSIAPVPSMPPNVAPLTTERVFDVTSSTTTTSHLRQKRNRPTSTPIVERASEPSATRRRTTNAAVNNSNIELDWQKVCDNTIVVLNRTKRDMSARISAVAARLETTSDRAALLALHRTIVDLDNTHTVLQNEIVGNIRRIQEMFERSGDTLQTAYAVLGRNITTLVDIPSSATTATSAPSSVAERTPNTQTDTQTDNVPPPPPPRTTGS